MAVEFEFDRVRTLKYDLAALGDMEGRLDKPLVNVYADILRRGINATTVALWAGLKHEDPSMTTNLARKLLQAYLDRGGKFQPVTDAIEKAFKAAGVFDKDDDEGNAPPEPAEK